MGSAGQRHRKRAQASAWGKDSAPTSGAGESVTPSGRARDGCGVTGRRHVGPHDSGASARERVGCAGSCLGVSRWATAETGRAEEGCEGTGPECGWEGSGPCWWVLGRGKGVVALGLAFLLMGWVALGFGCWAGFAFSISIPLSFLFLIQTKFEFKYKFEFKPHPNN